MSCWKTKSRCSIKLNLLHVEKRVSVVSSNKIRKGHFFHSNIFLVVTLYTTKYINGEYHNLIFISPRYTQDAILAIPLLYQLSFLRQGSFYISRLFVYTSKYWMIYSQHFNFVAWFTHNYYSSNFFYFHTVLWADFLVLVASYYWFKNALWIMQI